ncbi:hypothetical protein DSM101010T_16300 [Desulfovibrio subterraneus]|uniref:beta-N-acetylhexosaminidase n=1 Tax=Desulfovibrio subterraneus TaxID=2718620 RepID=A0A7J0BJE2_9BACT|nr:hypothetical protein DSM101010T_16300 [Desulfovibrio subterraneus]
MLISGSTKGEDKLPKSDGRVKSNATAVSSGKANVDSDCSPDGFDDVRLKRDFGQVFWVGFDGYEGWESTQGFINQVKDIGGVGGVVLGIGNVDVEDDSEAGRVVGFRKLLVRVRDAFSSNSTGQLLVGTMYDDSVRGLAQAGVMTAVPSAMALASARDYGYVRKAASIVSSEFGFLGGNVLFGPVLDVNMAGGANYIQDRSFGGDVSGVSGYGGAFLEGISGMVGVLMHFPGAGGVSSGVDSPGLVNGSVGVDSFVRMLEPFRDNIHGRNNVVLMTSNFCSDIVKGGCVSFDRRIVSDLIRSGKSEFYETDVVGLGYDGVVLTDDMSSPSVTSSVGSGGYFYDNYVDIVFNNIVRAFESGHDMYLLLNVHPAGGGYKDNYESESNGLKYRFGLTYNEFIDVYLRFKKYVFECKDVKDRLARMNKLAKSLKRIASLKNNLPSEVKYTDDILKDFDIAYEMRISNNKHREYAQQMFWDGFVRIPSHNSSRMLKNLPEDSIVSVFFRVKEKSFSECFAFGSGIISEDVANAEFSKNNYVNMFKSNFDCKFIPQILPYAMKDLDEIDYYTEKYAELIKGRNDDAVVVFVDSYDKWYFAQALVHFLKNNKYSSKKIHIVVTTHPTLMRLSNSRHEINGLYDNVNFYISYSLPSNHMSMFFRFVWGFGGEASSGRLGGLPIFLDGINPSPDLRMRNSTDVCTNVREAKE